MYITLSCSRMASRFRILKAMPDASCPLFNLANITAWKVFDKVFAPLCCADNRRTPKPNRMPGGLLRPKLLRNESEGQVALKFISSDPNRLPKEYITAHVGSSGFKGVSEASPYVFNECPYVSKHKDIR